ncbi:MAG: plasmid mobilization protein [Acutalibacteraceae bacterium]
MKTKRFNFRVSDTMDAVIREKAKSAGMSITDYIILCAINKKVINYDGLKELTTQVKKLGNNVNQLLILSRQGKIKTVNLTATQEELKKIYELLAKQFYGR